MLRRLLFLTLALTKYLALAQPVKVNSGFYQDSIAIGQPVNYFLTARYPENLNVLFPDSTFSFTPFEYVSKKYFPTQTTNGTSYDSVVYTLRTFELDAVQQLALPVFVPRGTDSLRFESIPDSIRLISQVKVLPPDTIPLPQLPLKTDTEYQLVEFLFNYPVVVIGSISLVIIAALTWFIFGKRIKKYFYIRRLQKDYAAFSQTFTGYLTEISRQFDPQLAERALALWKKYLEKLEQKPYTKLTTREMLLLETDSALGPALKALDGAIYGHQTSIDKPMEQLGKMAEQRFLKKLNDVKHG
ncbi:MAG: hypothetical protein HRU69_09615 [Flammeovirgaceae bacterium]|nr:MAG: hypothetical protein HRU69_09615 [Flammeovirgaceae bacterium]